jgi:hypothetical protein
MSEKLSVYVNSLRIMAYEFDLEVKLNFLNSIVSWSTSVRCGYLKFHIHKEIIFNEASLQLKQIYLKHNLKLSIDD